MEVLRQLDDGTLSVSNPADNIPDLKIGGPGTGTAAAPRFYAMRVAKMAVTAGVDTGGGILSFQNTFGHDIILTRFVIDVTTASSGACTIEVGSNVSTATTTGTNIISSQSVGTAGAFGSTTLGRISNGKYLTVSTASGGSAGLVGNVFIHYTPV